MRFDYRFKKGSDLETLVNYLSALDDLLIKDAIMQSARSYWMPLALKQAGVTETELVVAGNNAVIDLIRQAKEICLTLGIDSSQFAGLLGGSPAPMPTYWGAMPGGAVSQVVPPSPNGEASYNAPLTTNPPDSETKKDSGSLERWSYKGLGLENWPVNPVEEE
ncbi:hypothetical protein [Oscillatoria sp. FACHB-1406]|uniref:hypothetical protein n=1 Tax=Oscillatoria sp. FACHB-1406 TaxID=2692846 RepID=UPI001A7E29C4|nr:hypothetical protein [Oscillatoria sp. FACHB-1406]